MSRGIRIILIVIVVAVIVITGLWVRDVFNKDINDNGNVIDNNEEGNNNSNKPYEVSKYAKLYETLFKDIIDRDSGLNYGIEFISIDFDSLKGSSLDIEQKENVDLIPLDEEDIEYLVNYMKKYHDDIKTNTFEELKEQGRFDEERYVLDGILINCGENGIKKISEDKYEITLCKYRSGLGAIFPTYEVEYKNGKWEFKVIREAIS